LRTPNEHVLRFTVPVSVPGVTLEPGTYAFRVTAPATIQVLDVNKARAYAQFHTISAYGCDTALMNTYEMTFIRTSIDAPLQLIKLLVPGQLEGHELRYGAKTSPTPQLSNVPAAMRP